MSQIKKEEEEDILSLQGVFFLGGMMSSNCIS